MLQNFAGSGGKSSIHFNGSVQNIKLLLQRSSPSISSVFTEQGRRALEKPVASGQLDRQEILTQPPLAEVQANEERQGNLLQDYEQRNEKLSEDQKLSRLCSEAGSRSWTILLCSSFTKKKSKSISMPRIYVASRSKRNSCKRMDPKQCAIWPSLGHKKFAINTEDTVLKFKLNLCLKIKPNLGLELWTVLTNLSEKPCRSKRKRKLRRNPLQKRDQY